MSATTAKRALFERARALPAAARVAMLDAECDDPAIRAEVERLLDADARGGDPIAARVQRAAAHTAGTLNESAYLGAYRLVRLLGEGGMGSVWLAERSDGEFLRRAAIKVIRGAPSVAAIERLRRERQVLAGLEHPHIARLLDGGTTPQGEPYLVMEFVEGASLGDWLQRARPSLRARLQLFATLCRAVHFAHQRLIVHCDLKPANVLVRDDGAPMLLDFGIARLIDPGDEASRTATFAATPAYASPEQLLGQPVTIATDVFGLGMVLYELLAGRVPERGRDASSLSQELPAPSRLLAQWLELDESARVRGDLDSIVRRATRSESAQRYASAADLAADVEAWLDGRPVSAAGGHWRYLAGKFVRRHRVGVALGTLALLALLGLSLQLALQNRTVRVALAQAEREGAAARASTAFLEGLYGELDPRTAPGRRLDPRALVDLGVQRLDAMQDLDPRIRARLAHSLASLYRSIGAPDAALPLLDQAEAALAPEDDTTRLRIGRDRAFNHLAGLRYPECIAAVDAALPLARALGERVMEADLLSVRGTAKQNQNIGAGLGIADQAAAESIYRALGRDGDEGLRSLLYQRALAAEQAGDHERALRGYEEAHAMRARQLGPDHPTTLSAQFGVGKLLVMLGRNAQGRDRLLDLHERSLRVHGPDTEPVQRAAAELGSALRNLGEFDAAVARYDEALAISDVVNPGRDTIQDSLHLGNRALLEEMRGDMEAARTLFERAHAIRMSLFGPDSPWVANSAHFLARIALAHGDPEAAQRRIAAALAIRRERLAESHFERVMSEALAAEIAITRGESVDPALDARLRAVLAQPTPVRTHLAILRALAMLAQGRNDPEASLAMQHDEIALLIETHAPQHAVVGEAQLRLARRLLDAGRRSEAEQAWRAGAAIVDRTHVETSPARLLAQELARDLR